jgi:Ion channel
MNFLITAACVSLILIVLHDAFESVILPRRVTRPYRLTRLFYAIAWPPWSFFSRTMRNRRNRDSWLSFFGPLSLLLLLAMWAIILISAFATLQWNHHLALHSNTPVDFTTYLYMSGTTFFTLGFGDVTPLSLPGRFMNVLEAGLGFAFLALVVGYLPVLYQGFSRREGRIALLDARAGSPPSAAELLRRNGNPEELTRFLREWESWSAELLETHLSYPVLCYYRSQHNNQSWLAAVTVILDTCATLIATAEGALLEQAELTFAMARHAVVDLAQIFNTPPADARLERLSSEDFEKFRAILESTGFHTDDQTEQKLADIRKTYEPLVLPLGRYLLLSPPPWVPAQYTFDNWQTSRWGRISTRITKEED